MSDTIRKSVVRMIPFLILGGFIFLFIRLVDSSIFTVGLVTTFGVFGIISLEKSYLKFFKAEYDNAISRLLNMWIALVIIIGVVLFASVSVRNISGGR